MPKVFSRNGIAIAAAAVTELVGLPLHAAEADFTKAVLATRPIAYYRLASTEGKSEVGATTYKPVGGVVSSSPGAPLGPGSFYAGLNGRDAYIKTTQQGGVGATASIMIWVNLASLPSQAGHLFYVAGEAQVGNDLDVQFDTDNALKFWTAAGGHLTYTPAPATLLNQWHMIVATMDTASQTRVIYWDGKPVANDQGGGSTGKTGAFLIGATEVFPGRWFHGGMEEAALWDRTLTAAEVASIYATATPGAAAPGGGGVSRSAAPGPSLFPTTAKVSVGENDGKDVPLKPEEKVAVLFLSAIQTIENDCQSSDAKLACSMDQLRTAGAGHAQHLKFDTRTDPNYTYTVGISGMAWEARATPKKPGLIGFYFMQRSWPGSTLATYNRGGAAGVIDTEIGNRSIEGDSFATQ